LIDVIVVHVNGSRRLFPLSLLSNLLPSFLILLRQWLLYFCDGSLGFLHLLLRLFPGSLCTGSTRFQECSTSAGTSCTVGTC
jgi:hypothetical protein